MFSTSTYSEDAKTKQEQYAELKRKLDVAKAALDEAMTYANEQGLSFRMSPAYGMGGTFYGTNHPEFESVNEYVNYEQGLDNGWSASSQSC